MTYTIPSPTFVFGFETPKNSLAHIPVIIDHCLYVSQCYTDLWKKQKAGSYAASCNEQLGRHFSERATSVNQQYNEALKQRHQSLQ
jgi:hypothetical protein